MRRAFGGGECLLWLPDAQVVLLLDADFIVSHDLHEALTQSDKSAALMEDLTANRRVVVLPAFETEGSLGVEAGGDMALQAQASASAFVLTCVRVTHALCLRTQLTAVLLLPGERQHDACCVTAKRRAPGPVRVTHAAMCMGMHCSPVTLAGALTACMRARRRL